MTKLVGITGGIGSGKTTFSNYLKKLGYLVHESDVVVSKIYTKPTKQFLSFVKEKISQDAVNHNKINKAEIANIIFSNNKIRKLLERNINKLPWEKIISHQFNIDNVHEAMDVAMSDQSMKVILNP